MLRFLLLNEVRVLAAMMSLERIVVRLEIQNGVLIQEEGPIPGLSDGWHILECPNAFALSAHLLHGLHDDEL